MWMGHRHVPGSGGYEGAAHVAAALDLASDGADFADALHLVRSGHCADFVTFDRALVAGSNGKATLLQRDA
jgi:hypothetical protein